MRTRRVLAATGVTDELPDIEGLAEQWGRGVIHCPFCHGFEVRDRRLVMVVTHPLGLHPAAVWRHLGDRLMVVLHANLGDDVEASQVAALQASGVPVVRGEVHRVLGFPDGAVTGVELATGERLDADAVLAGVRFHARLDSLTGLGLAATDHPSGAGDHLVVDPVTS